MAESIEQAMRTLKLGGMAKEWRSVAYENNEQYTSQSYENLKGRKNCSMAQNFLLDMQFHITAWHVRHGKKLKKARESPKFCWEPVPD